MVEMTYESKKTDRAAFVALWHNNELLVLQSRKWRSEGTPYLLPGGGFKEEDENRTKVCVRRELREETQLIVPHSELEYFGDHKTEWSNCDFFEVVIPKQEIIGINLEEKLFGYEWWNFQEDKLRIQALKPFMMPGLKWYLEQKGLL